MRSLLLLGVALTAPAFGQNPNEPKPPSKPQTVMVPATNGPAVPMMVIGPNTLVATIDGRQFTAGEMDAILNSFQGLRENMKSNPRMFLERYGVLMALTRLAEANGLDKARPFKERLEYTRMQILWQAQIDRQYNQFPVTETEAKQYYEENKEKFFRVKVRAIYLPFSPAPPPNADPKAKKILSETEARELAAQIAAKARAGADFAGLVKEYSQDPTSAAKGGEFGTFKKDDKIPDNIKTVLFALKKDEVSDPVKQPNGYYVFRADEAGQQEYSQVMGTLVSEIRDHKLQAWLLDIGKSTKATIENEAYFGLPAAKPEAVK